MTNEFKKSILVIFSVVLVFTLLVSVNSQNVLEIGPFEYGEDVELIQTSSTSNYINISVIESENGNVIIQDSEMLKNGNVFTYTIEAANFSKVGTYIVLGTNQEDSFSYTFEVIRGDSLDIDFRQPINIVIIAIVFFVIVALAMFRKIVIAGALSLLIGFILLYSGVNAIISFIIIAMGVTMIFSKS